MAPENAESLVSIIETILAHTTHKTRNIEFNRCISDLLILDYFIDNLSDDFLSAAVKNGKTLTELVISDYLLGYTPKARPDDLLTLSFEKSLQYFNRRLKKKTVGKKEDITSQPRYSVDPQINISALAYLHMLENVEVRRLLTEAKDKNDLKSVLMISIAYSRISNSERDPIIGEEGNLEQKAVKFLKAYMPVAIRDMLMQLPETAKSQRSQTSPLFKAEYLKEQDIARLSAAMQLLDDYKRECEEYKSDPALYSNPQTQPLIDQGLVAVQEAKQGIQAALYARNQRITKELEQISREVSTQQASGKKERLQQMKERLQSYLGELQLVKQTEVLYS